MTTHQLAGLIDTLRSGMAPLLKADAAGVKAFEEAAEAFREHPDQPLKEFVKQVRAALAPGNGKTAGKGKKPAIDVNALIDHIRSARAGEGPFDPIVAELDALGDKELKTILTAFGGKGTNGKAKNLERVKALLVVAGDTSVPLQPVPPAPAATDTTLVEHGVRLFEELEKDPNVSILEVRARMAPIRQYPKPVVEEISRRVGYTPDDTREKTFDRMLSNLEGIKMSQLRAKMILN